MPVDRTKSNGDESNKAELPSINISGTQEVAPLTIHLPLAICHFDYLSPP